MMLQELLLPIFQDYGIYNFTLAAVKAGILHCAKSDRGEVAAFQSLFSLYSGSVLSCSVDLTSTYSFVVLERAKDLFVEAGTRLPFQLFFLLGEK